VKDPSQLAATIDEAFRIATEGRPGPVVIDIPKDVQVASATWTEVAPQQRNRYAPQTEGNRQDIAEAIALIAARKRRSSTPAAA
jgi:acetolactate synthase-1/2/3 large subunit